MPTALQRAPVQAALHCSCALCSAGSLMALAAQRHPTAAGRVVRMQVGGRAELYETGVTQTSYLKTSALSSWSKETVRESMMCLQGCWGF